MNMEHQKQVKIMEKIVKFQAGYDCIKFECKMKSKACIPYNGGSHGVHGTTITFILKSEDGVVQFVIFTGWLPQYIKKDSIGTRHIDTFGDHPMPAGLGYHSKKPRYNGQRQQATSCEYCDGEPCYYDESCLNAYDAMYALVNGGDTALWVFLEKYYNCVFSDGEYPEPAEYPMPLRAT